ncbi:exosome component 8-like protein [Piromyces finnis]|uniref:Ribosomal RNA-processing protein 43 n=1 Tax=Piromyces finnis TaxID=1754191 RepID=A0A1Y1VGB1_9FUNG|nr:exosome component 8-like protein [Piromyces finnis]|eukprot:ORX55399.1 exosome component 8-like protein [Piromyces finnis]
MNEVSNKDSFVLDANTFAKLHPKEFYRKFLTNNIRPDGRLLKKFRKTSINLNSLKSAEGSCVLKMGKTSVVCGIKAEVAEPRVDDPRKGYIVPNVELSPICSSIFKPGPPGELAQSISERIDKLFKQCKIIDLDKLCISEKNAVWVLYIDVICLSYDGNIFDAALYSIISALKSLKLPEVTFIEEEGKAEASKEKTISLELLSIPLSATYVVFDDKYVLADPNEEEENLSSTSITFIYNEEHKLCGISKLGGIPLSSELIQDCMSSAIERTDSLRELLESTLQRN